VEVVAEVAKLQSWADARRSAGRRIGLVPTMGALHRGHLSLIEHAYAHADPVCVSIFVNPTQFNDAGDLDRYPRTLDADLEACRSAGVEVVFTPSVREMYPTGAQTAVEVSGLTDALCGATRPGHFNGVTTVVSKLLLAAKPHVAVFGEKDFQQLAVIRRMARDLLIDVEILGAPTVREPDGLAMSSRNENLDAEARSQATVLVRALDAVEAAVAAGERSSVRLLRVAGGEISKSPRAALDYLELRNPETLEPAPSSLQSDTLLALAVVMRPLGGAEGGVRLIDNRVLDASRVYQEGAR
jgi:pantoate--beta-alanine ligase